MKLLILTLLLVPFLASAHVQGEFGAYSNFIWRGTTFSENKPAIQLDVANEFSNGLYIGSFLSNAEFKDDARGDDTTVSSEIDGILGKRWEFGNWEVQTYYSQYYFPGADLFNTDEWNFQVRYHRTLLELSYMDDYFGYQGTYSYVRVGQEWTYSNSFDGALFVGFNMFQRPRGDIIENCQNATCSVKAEGLNGASNNDYFDVFFINRKVLDNQTSLNLAFNWTNRDEYTVERGEIIASRAKDFAVIISYAIPFNL